MPLSTLQILATQHELTLQLNSRQGLAELTDKFARTVVQRYLLRNTHYYFLDISSGLLNGSSFELGNYTIKSANNVNVSHGFHEYMIQNHKVQSDKFLKCTNPENDNHCTLFKLNNLGFVVFESRKEMTEIQTRSLLPIIDIFTDHCVACVEKEALRTSHQQLERSHEIIYNQLYYDELTALPNRKFFIKKVEEKLSSYQDKQAFVLFNIKQFDLLNTKYGYKNGDQIILRLGQIIRRSLQGKGELYRMGGDEFLVHFDRITSEDNSLADEISVFMEEVDNQMAQTEVERITIELWSVANFFDLSVNNHLDALSHTQFAMSKLRSDRRKQTTTITNDLRERFEYEHQIHTLLSNKIPYEQFRIVLQPQCNASGEILGAEVLARWRQPDLGDIPPDLFISILEANNKVIDFDKFIFQKSLELKKLLASQVPKYPQLAVNVSGFSLINQDFLDDLMKPKWKDSGLVIELTESALLEDLDMLSSIFMKLNEQGFEVHLDDFGTAHSSISYLMTLKEGALKIDRSFIRYIDKNKKQKQIVKSIMSLSKACNLEVIAEGLESKAELNVLMNLGVDDFQGYYFHKPLEVDDFIALLKEQTI